MRYSVAIAGGFALLAAAAPQVGVTALTTHSAKLAPDTDTLSASATAGTISASTLPTVVGPRATSAASVDLLIAQLKQDQSGYVHVANDGVARVWTAGKDGKVVDYVRLTNVQLKELFANTPAWVAPYDTKVLGAFDTVDGTTVTDEAQLWDPPADLRPAAAGGETPDTDAKLDAQVKVLEAKYEAGKEVKEKLKSRQLPQCQNSSCVYNSDCVALGCRSCMWISVPVTSWCLSPL